ncbi:hypothetical protein PIB30_057653 [Stylosanthes scabra]|uniref:Uncharacterized protein n=1 Tax=Stylosanthes scabra TaxID=79078 RepID=A0ABU6YIA3_9FABA|nr:hypothetical protein [Stylosanthes scabra]
MGGTNPVLNVLCVHNNVEPRSQQNSSKSRVTGKNSPWLQSWHEIPSLTLILLDSQENLVPKSSWVVVIKTKPRGRIESDQTKGEEPYQTDYPTPSKIVGDTGPLVSLATPQIADEVIDVGGDIHTVTPDMDDEEEQDAEAEDEEEGEFDVDDFSTEDEDNNEENLDLPSNDDD